MREPCPCGSGRRYKACHGREAARAGQALVVRPFAGLADECDWVAVRELVPAATAALTLAGGTAPGGTAPGDGGTAPGAAPAPGGTAPGGGGAARDGAPPPVTLATVLPLAWPALVRQDGSVWLALQVPGGSGDPSRDAADALLRALGAEPGTPVPPVGIPGPGPRLQDLLDASAPLRVTVHAGFDYWVEDADSADPAVRASLERANAQASPTRRLTGVDAAYWCRLGTRDQLRWVLPEDEDPLLDALARLHAAGADSLGEGTRLLGTFRASGLLVPVWDLRPGTEAGAVEAPAAAWRARLDDALADPSPLTAQQRSARSGLVNRQLTLR